ncbi:hypothetical protein [Williamsia serinedens]|uniref:DUF4267 domain-containing protein n=1 Tax=Williamsia serinedens TaxID=391736 RepID=A0ABT1H1N9_9NOCA|nr:hypothetical protein [Williamsia serinedens]MCP2160899.1 hypothetical protein [Williamsia serinedens]
MTTITDTPSADAVRTALPRVLGAVTAAYSAALLVRPRLLAKPCGFAATDEVPRSVAVLVRGIAVRDLASGAAMVAAPQGEPLRAGIAVRAAADFGDAIVFGTGLTRQRAPKIAGFAAVWGALCAASGVVART